MFKIFISVLSVAVVVSAVQLPLAQKEQMAAQKKVTSPRGDTGNNCNQYSEAYLISFNVLVPLLVCPADTSVASSPCGASGYIPVVLDSEAKCCTANDFEVGGSCSKCNADVTSGGVSKCCLNCNSNDNS